MNVSKIASDFIGCPGYGTLNIRSISSTGTTPELKDVIAPIPLDLSTCGQLSWLKQDDSGKALGGATFTVTPNPATGTGSVDVTDNQAPDTDNRDGHFKLVDVIPGDYTVVEKSAPNGYILDTKEKTVTVDEYEHKSIQYVWVNTEIKPPTITTTSSTTTADFGQTVHDDATLTGDQGLVTGTVQFFICGPEATAPDCSTGGTKVGSATNVVNGEATSPNFTVGLTAAASGHYCWRAEYTPDSSAPYLAGKHTNKTTECFYVAPATISITKTANPAGPVSAGDEIGFDITVTNDGTQTTLGVSMTDTLPAGISWTADAPTGATAQCSITNGTLSCTASSLAAKASFTVHIHGNSTPAVCGKVDNTANVITSNDGSASDDASVVVNCPALKVTKTADAATVNAGDDIGFTVKVENTGKGIAYGATLSDPLPAGVTWTIDPAYADQGSCSISSGKLTCDFGDLASGASVSVHVAATTSYEACSTYDNTATASATNAPDASDSASITCDKPALKVTKTADAATVNAGDDIGFTVKVENTGKGIAYGATLSDPLPAGVTWTIDPAYADQGSCSISSGKLTCDFGDLASGASVSVHVAATTSYEACSTYDNTATASATNAPDASDSASITCDKPALKVTKTADAATVNAGDDIGFTVKVENTGKGIAYGATLSDPLPAGVTWTIDPAYADQGSCSISSGKLTCDFGDLASGASVSVHVAATTSYEACSTYDNTATASATNAPDASDSASITCDKPALKVTKTADNSPISAGDTASYTIVVENTGAGTAYSVSLTDTLPAGIAWVADNQACSISSGKLTCDFGDLASGASATVTVSGETTADSCGQLPNTATASATNAPDASDSATIQVDCPEIVITKTPVDPMVNATDQIAFDIVVKNNGDGNAYGVTVSDTLPTEAGLSWSIDGANSDAGWSIAGGTLSFGPATLASGESVRVRIVSPTTPASCGTVLNTASLTYDGGTGSDNGQITVDCPDLSLTKTADTSPILAGRTRRSPSRSPTMVTAWRTTS